MAVPGPITSPISSGTNRLIQAGAKPVLGLRDLYEGVGLDYGGSAPSVSLPSGLTELGCHPAAGEDLDSMYASERLVELKTLCDPRVRAALSRAKVRLCSFEDVR